MSSKNVIFSKIPSGARKPGAYMEFNTTLAVRTLPDNAQTVLILASRLAAGTVAAGVPTDVYSEDQAITYFGAGSLVHRMVKAAITAYQYVTLTVIAVDDAQAGVAATGKYTFSGPATADGAYSLYIGRDTISVAIESGATAADIAQQFADLVAQTPALPVTATAANGVLTLSAKNKGTSGNTISLGQLGQTTGVSAAITAFSGGLIDPDLTTALAAVYGASYNIYAPAWTTQAILTTLRTHLESISGPMEKRPATAWVGLANTLSAGTTLSTAMNDGLVSIAVYPGSVSMDCEITAGYSATAASETDPAMPLDTMSIAGLDVVPIANRLGRTEQETALKNGVTPLEVGPDGNSVQIVRAISTYTVNATGTADVSLLDMTTIRTLHYARKAWLTRYNLRFPRGKLTPDKPAKVRTEMLDVAYQLQDLEILENIDTYKDAFVFEEDEQSVGQLNARLPAPVVPGLHVFATVIDLYLQ